MIGFRCQRRLTQGPAVRLANRRHSLRRCMVTMTRSAYVLIRCAVVVRCGASTVHGTPSNTTRKPTLDSIMTAPPSKPSTSRPRLRSDGMAPDGAALVTGAFNQPGVAGQVGAQPSPTRVSFAFTQVDGTSRSGPTVASPMGRPMVSAGDEVSASLLAGCATAGDVGLYRQAGCSPSATEGYTSERGTRARHRQLFVDRTTPSA